MLPEIAPQATQLKDVLRALRYTLRKGRDTMREKAPRRLPTPASGIALSALDEIEVLARNVDQLACNFAHTVLGGSTSNYPDLRQIIASSNPENEFAVSYYEVMKVVLARLGAKRALVSESSGKRAFARLGRGQEVVEMAARLTLQLISEGSVAIDKLDERSPVNPPTANAVAVFAGLLAMLAESEDSDREAMISAATDLAVVHQEKIWGYSQKNDVPGVTSLLQRCAPHV